MHFLSFFYIEMAQVIKALPRHHYSTLIVKALTANALVTKEAAVSTAMVLTLLFHFIPTSAPEGLRLQ